MRIGAQDNARLDPRLQRLALELLEPGWDIVTPTAAVARSLRGAGRHARRVVLRELPSGEAAACALLDLELSRAGEHAEELLADVARVLRPGGAVLVTAASSAHSRATRRQLGPLRPFSANELRAALGHRGYHVAKLIAPGAAASLRGPDGAGHEDGDDALDRMAGLLDAAPVILAAAHNATSPEMATRAFFGSLPLKVVAAAVICRDTNGRLLLVHDSFKQHWTIPGGVVDADEDPLRAAVRETREEAGLRVRAGELLGVFVAPGPDRVLFIYAAQPEGDLSEAVLRPLHAHEIDAVEWAHPDDALARVTPRVAWQIRRCVQSPGGTWREP